eukprot:PRCOL_00000873-RA
MRGAAPAGDAEGRRRVVITGMGVVSPVGNSVDEFYDSLCAGVSGVREISHFDAGELPTRFAAEVKELDTSARISKKQARRVDDVIKYTLVAGKDALDDAGLLSGDARDALDASRAGILVGSAMGGMKTFADACADLTVHGKRMNPFCIPFSITNMSGALLAMDVGFMGPNYSLSTACATANYCMMNSYDYIQRGEADVMLAGGADAAIVPMGMAGFSACKALSQRNEEPTTASRPWDKTRDGFVMGEGAGVLVMEELEHARARGATIYAEFLGGAMTCDAHHMTEPHPEGKGVKRCMQLALERAGIDAGRVNYINAHATSTPAGDLAEYNAIVEIFGDNDDLKINGTKAMVGHLLGAAGAVEAVATVQACVTGKLHPNPNLEEPEDAVDLGLLVGKDAAEDHEVDVALSNSFGFGGHNSAVLIKRWTGE